MIDSVHDTQKVFRTLVKASSYPGTVLSLRETSEKLDLDSPLSPALLLMAMTLLDREVRFHSPYREQEIFLTRLTYSPAVLPEEADFIIIPKEWRGGDLIRKSRTGTLIDPHLGATVILEVDELQETGGWILTGPGIKTEKTVGLGSTEKWLGSRNEKVKEFPLGIDFFLIDDLANLMSIPRTTRIRRSE